MSDQPETISRQTPGEMLYQARTRAHLSLDAVAHELKMTVTKIKSIEDNNFDPFPADTYLKGYLKNYARMVGLNEEEVMQAYRDLIKTRHGASNSSLEKPKGSQGQHLSIALLLLLVLLLGVYYFMFIKPTTTNEQPSKGVEDTASPLAAEAEINEPEPVTPSLQLNNEEFELKAAVLEPLNLVKQSVNRELAFAQSASSQNKVAEIEQFVLKFDDNCWVQVIDKNGKKILTQEYVKGEKLTLDGEGPFNVTLGNAEVVSLYKNQEMVTLTPRSDSKILKLTLKH